MNARWGCGAEPVLNLCAYGARPAQPWPFPNRRRDCHLPASRHGGVVGAPREKGAGSLLPMVTVRTQRAREMDSRVHRLATVRPYRLLVLLPPRCDAYGPWRSLCCWAWGWYRSRCCYRSNPSRWTPSPWPPYGLEQGSKMRAKPPRRRMLSTALCVERSLQMSPVPRKGQAPAPAALGLACACQPKPCRQFSTGRGQPPLSAAGNALVSTSSQGGFWAYISAVSSLMAAMYQESSLTRWLRMIGEVARSSSIRR